MKKEFAIGQSNEIIKGQKIIDLHNEYDFVGVILKGNECRLQIQFAPNPEHGKGKPHITLNFDGIDYLEFSPNFGTRPISGLDEIGYKNVNDRDDNWLLTEQQATDKDHLFFRMDGGSFIRIHSQHADVYEESRGQIARA